VPWKTTLGWELGLEVSMWMLHNQTCGGLLHTFAFAGSCPTCKGFFISCSKIDRIGRRQ